MKKLRVSLAKAPGRLWFGSDLTDARCNDRVRARIAKIGVKMLKIWPKQVSRDLFARKIYKRPIWNFF